MAIITLYTTQQCPYCVAAKKFLKDKQLDFTEIPVDGDDAKRQWLRETTGRRTVPQIFINNQSVGGYDDLVALDQRGELAKLLNP